MRGAAAALLAALSLAAAGCGDDAGGTGSAGAARSSSLVDTRAERPWVNAFDVLPRSGDLLLATNRGLFRIAANGSSVRRVRGRVRDAAGTSPVGTFLFLRAIGGRTLLGSGHPDDERALPPYLGLIRSEDEGRSWTVVSRLAEADLHQVRLAGRELYAFDAATSSMLRSQDGGRTFQDSAPPEPLLVDFVVDPADRDVLVASGENGLYRSQDGGRRWRRLERDVSPRLAWPSADRLLRADRDGRVRRSGDGGRTWHDLGRVDGEPVALAVGRGGELLLALTDGTVLASSDGGATFETRFTPPTRTPR
ncbi:glycoside hydrolase [Conexibacter sp. SYSU D00693]|uniref:WD40/YVTN/BNR-like repeat-containing protein n=1 Tax=Conexibacter sp. SYSU D00693 TaxID=2812560 RepID=UPI00196B17FA|nr:glycoside hydrolase [Conexibacter sp. SYSU D00693]